MPFYLQFDWLTKILSGSSAVVKVTAFFLAWLILWLPIAIPLAIGLKWRPFQPLTIGQKLTFVLTLYALAPFILWKFAQIDGVPFAAFGLNWLQFNSNSLLLGLCLGVLGVSVLLGTERWFNWVNWQQIRWDHLASAFLPTLLLGLLVSVVEELVFRGFLLNQFQQDYPLWFAAISSSLIFALLHLVWEGKAIMPQLPGLWLMGIVLVLARWVDSGNLELACGLHAGWIWAMASLDAAQMLQYNDRSPEWLTGLGGKPLAGVMGGLLLLVTGAVLSGLVGKL